MQAWNLEISAIYTLPYTAFSLSLKNYIQHTKIANQHQVLFLLWVPTYVFP